MHTQFLHTQAVLGASAMALPPITWFISCAISTFTGLQYIMKSEYGIKDVGHGLRHKYDFIVIGSGSAGAVVANRLSEISSWKVLLLEAGVDETEISNVPVFAQHLQLSSVDWQYKTEPQPTSCLAMIDGRCNWPRGKSLGGSSAINAMLYLRGHRKDFDNWEALGNKGWSYKDVLPYFIKSEDNNNPKYTATPYHGTGGYLSVSDTFYKTPLADAFVQAGVELGYPEIDINGESQTGFSIIQGTQRNGRRCSTAKAFLRPIKDRPNLHIAMNAFVKKININPITKRVESVVVFKDSKLKVIKARQEIILSAGAIGSPHLLMLSGIGPRKDLLNAGIPVIKNLSVGRNLQDHIALGGLVFIVNSSDVISQEKIFKFENFYKYAFEGTGPLTSKVTVEAVGYIHTKYADPSEDYPDMQLQFAASAINADGGGHLRAANGLPDQFYKSVYETVAQSQSWTVAPMLMRPRSKGYMKIISKDPFVKPLLYSNYLTDPLDVKIIREGVKFILAMAKTKALQKYGSRVHDVPFPACAKHRFMSNKYIECATRQYTLTIYHQSGTCKMGPASDRTAVVDPKLRVYGIRGLRVVDASIMPNVVGTNTNAATIMIGERGSDLIKESYGY